MTSQPFMPLFFGDFLAATPTWDGQERALYLLLLAYQWSAGPLPKDVKKLARMTQYEPKPFAALWMVVGKKFVEIPEGLVNERLEEHRAKSLALSEKNSNSGKKGAAARWQKGSGEDGERHSANDGERHKSAKESPLPTGNGNPSHPIPTHSSTPPGFRTQSAPEDWQGHHDWAFRELRAEYPTNLYTDADWLNVSRVIAGRLEAGETTREELLTLTIAFAAQQDAKGSRNSQYIENPCRHFDGRGKWRGPFALPASQTKPQQVTAMDRIYAATEPEPEHHGYLEHGQH